MSTKGHPIEHLASCVFGFKSLRQVFCANAGDSRCVLARWGSCEVLFTDQSLSCCCWTAWQGRSCSKPVTRSQARAEERAQADHAGKNGRGVGVGSDAIPHLLHACFNAKSSRTQAGGFVSADGRVDGNLADSPGKVRARERERESAEPSPSLQNLSRSLGDFAYKKDASRKAPLHCAKTFRGMNLEAK